MELTYIFNDDDFTYTPSDEDITECIIAAFASDYKLVDFQARQIVEDFDLRDTMIEYYKDYIKDSCEQDAYKAYKEHKI